MQVQVCSSPLFPALTTSVYHNPLTPHPLQTNYYSIDSWLLFSIVTCTFVHTTSLPPYNVTLAFHISCTAFTSLSYFLPLLSANHIRYAGAICPCVLPRKNKPAFERCVCRNYLPYICYIKRCQTKLLQVALALHCPSTWSLL